MTVNTYFMNDNDANLTIIDPNSNTHQLEGYQAPEEPCPAGLDDCGVRYSLTRRSDFNTSTWYEQVRYSQQRPGTSEDDDNDGFGELAFRTYVDLDCVSRPDLYPKRSWNCERGEDEADCADLGLQSVIASFSIEPVTEEERSSGTCDIAVQESGASGDSAVTRKSLLVALMSFVLTYAAVETIV
ncbi:hypothetical protein Slin14017_G125690 [Septoria linicola]|nr:hypothetical protein Slin14017_G125690 [Septoria linicola]